MDGEVPPTVVRSAAESLCYPWLGRSVHHLHGGADQAFVEATKIHDAPNGTVAVRLQNRKLTVWLAAERNAPAVAALTPRGPYVYAYSESARWVDAFELQRGVWDGCSRPDVFAVNGRAGTERDLIGRRVSTLYSRADRPELPVPAGLEAMVGQDAAAASIFVACSLGRPSLILAVDQGHSASVAVHVSPDIAKFLPGRIIKAHTESRPWRRLEALATHAGVELMAIRRLVTCTFELAEETAAAGALHGWSPAIEPPACADALGTLAPLAAFVTAMSWALRDAPEPVMWLHGQYGAVLRAPSPVEHDEAR